MSKPDETSSYPENTEQNPISKKEVNSHFSGVPTLSPKYQAFKLKKMNFAAMKSIANKLMV